MYKLALIVLMNLVFGCIAFAQRDSLTVQKVLKTKNVYKAFVTKGNQIFALTHRGRLIVWDLNKLDTLPFPNAPKDEYFTAIAMDNEGDIFVGSHKGNLYTVNPKNLTYSLFSKNTYHIHSICFNSENKLFLLFLDAVYEPIEKKIWHQFENIKNGLRYMKEVDGELVETEFYFAPPDFSFLDSQDRLWMYKSAGEWGYELQIFDTRNEEIVSSDFVTSVDRLYSVEAIFEDESGALYIVSTEFDSQIYKFINDSLASSIYPPEPVIDTVATYSYDQDEQGAFTITAKLPPLIGKKYINFGPAIYNEVEKNVYFTMKDSLFVVSLSNQEFAHEPKALFKENMLTEATGYTDDYYSLKANQLAFSHDNKLIYLTRFFIGIYHDSHLILLK